MISQQQTNLAVSVRTKLTAAVKANDTLVVIQTGYSDSGSIALIHFRPHSFAERKGGEIDQYGYNPNHGGY